jgi:hypothetical protein
MWQCVSRMVEIPEGYSPEFANVTQNLSSIPRHPSVNNDKFLPVFQHVNVSVNAVNLMHALNNFQTNPDPTIFTLIHLSLAG